MWTSNWTQRKLSIDVLHVSQLRIEVSGSGHVDIDDVVLVNRYPTLYNFVKVLRDDYFGRYLLNSAIVSVSSVLGNLFFCSMVAYVFARKRFRFKELLFSLVLATMMIPPQVTIIPTFILMKKLALIDTYWALILPNLVTPFGIFLMRQYIEQLRSNWTTRHSLTVRTIFRSSGTYCFHSANQP